MSGRKKSLSHHLSRREPDDSQLDAAMKEFLEGSDRVAAIMGAALVENHLMGAIRVSLTDAFNDNVLFQDQGAPFGTFKSRIVAGRALGLFGEQMANDLDIMRDIRNQFAHALLSIDFDNPHLAERCALFSEHNVTDVDGGPLDFTGPAHRKVSPTRLTYETMCWKLSILLLQRGTQILRQRADRLEAAVNSHNPQGFGTLSDLVTASIESGAKDVENHIATDNA